MWDPAKHAGLSLVGYWRNFFGLLAKTWSGIFIAHRHSLHGVSWNVSDNTLSCDGHKIDIKDTILVVSFMKMASPMKPIPPVTKILRPLTAPTTSIAAFAVDPKSHEQEKGLSIAQREETPKAGVRCRYALV